MRRRFVTRWPGSAARVRVQEDAGLPRCVEGQHDSRIPLDVAHLGRSTHVPGYEAVAVQSDLDDAHLWAPIGVDGAQMAIGPDAIKSRSSGGYVLTRLQRSGVPSADPAGDTSATRERGEQNVERLLRGVQPRDRVGDAGPFPFQLVDHARA